MNQVRSRSDISRNAPPGRSHLLDAVGLRGAVRPVLFPSPSPRPGFTLIELMMVIVVIGILTSLIVVASMSVLTTSREAATKATLTKINTMLKERMSAFETHYANLIAGGEHKPLITGPVNERAAKVIYRKQLFKNFFPQTWSETTTIAGIAGVTPQTTTSANATEAQIEAAEVLFMFLTKTSITGQSEIGQDAFLASETSDKDNDGHKELIDSWGNPLVFYRWPTNLIKNSPVVSKALIPATGSSTLVLTKDPDDPLGDVTTTNYPNFASDFHDINTYHIPLVVSAGLDGLLGLYLPGDTANPEGKWAKVGTVNETYDNLTDQNSLSGGSQ